MAKSRETFNKKQNEKNKTKKREDKARRKEERKANSTGGGLDSMMAYVDEFGNLTSTPPDPLKKVKVDATQIELGVPKREATANAYVDRKGVVTMFSQSKGYGFIRDVDSGASIFTHIKDHVDTIHENDRVTFKIGQSPKGPTAIEVKVG